jgi:Rrf2 family protein
MKLSKKGRYGLVALMDLTVNSQNEYVSLSSIAERNGISLKYLEQVFSSFKKAGIVKSVKGPQGGYLLGTAAEKIIVADVIEALEGSYHLEEEDTSQRCPYCEIAVVLQSQVIDRVNQELDNILKNLTLADLVREYQAGQQDMYYI